MHTFSKEFQSNNRIEHENHCLLVDILRCNINVEGRFSTLDSYLFFNFHFHSLTTSICRYSYHSRPHSTTTAFQPISSSIQQSVPPGLPASQPQVVGRGDQVITIKVTPLLLSVSFCSLVKALSTWFSRAWQRMCES